MKGFSWFQKITYTVFRSQSLLF